MKMEEKKYTIQRLDLLGKRPLILREENCLRLEVCNAIAYFAYYSDVNPEGLIANFKNALEKQYGNVFSIELSWQAEMTSNMSLPVDIDQERKIYQQIPFRIQVLPAFEDISMYRGVIDCPYMELVMFIPRTQMKYFDSHSVYLDYRQIGGMGDWENTLQKVTELNKLCIPVLDWLK